MVANMSALLDTIEAWSGRVYTFLAGLVALSIGLMALLIPLNLLLVKLDLGAIGWL